MTAWYGHLEVVQLLIQNGANAQARDNQAIREAACHGQFEVVQLLVQNGAKDNEAIRYAAWNGHLEVVQLLIQNRANVQARENDAIRLAAQKGHLEVVRLILDHVGMGLHVLEEDNERNVSDQRVINVVRDTMRRRLKYALSNSWSIDTTGDIAYYMGVGNTFRRIHHRGNMSVV